MKFSPLLANLAFIVLFVSCTSSVEKVDGSTTYQLSAKEKKDCDSMKLDSAVIIELRAATSARLEPFHYSLSKEISPDGTEKELDPIRLNGLVFTATASQAENMLEQLQDKLKAKGYYLFTLERNYGIGNAPDWMGLLKTTDQYEVLKQVKTDGINYNIDTDSLIEIVKQFDQKYKLEMVGTSGDWCEFRIKADNVDWMAMATEAYKACPDIVDQGTGTIEALAEELKNTRRLYFWWD